MIAATALAALLLSAGMGMVLLLPVAFPIALLVTMPIGMLLYAAARVTGCAGWFTAGTGGLIASMVAWLPDLFSPPSLDEQWFDGVATVIAGQYTQLGWFEHLIPAAGLAAIGLISGLFFWFLHVRHSLSGNAQRLAYLLAGLAVIGASLYPFATQDRSCHSAHPRPTVAQLGLAIPSDQWPALARELDGFAQAGNWSTRKHLSARREFPWLDFSLCEPNSVRIFALASPGFDEANLPVSISLTQLQEGAEWKPAFRALHDRLEARWPGAIRYQDANGVDAPRPPDWLVSPAPSSTAR